MSSFDEEEAVIATGRWLPDEHAAFIQGLKQFGPNWRSIQSLVPTRTLIQIRTHAQKYFNKIGVSVDRSHATSSDESIVAAVGEGAIPLMIPRMPTPSVPRALSRRKAPPPLAGSVGKPAGSATLRHVMLEPTVPTDPLGLRFGTTASGAIVVEGFVPVARTEGSDGTLVPSSSTAAFDPALNTTAGGSLNGSALLGNELLRIGDVLVGVSGISCAGMTASEASIVIKAARSVTPAGAFVLHLCSMQVPDSVHHEAIAQCSGAAAQLLGKQQIIDEIQHAAFSALSAAHQSTSAVTFPGADGCAGQTIFARAGLAPDPVLLSGAAGPTGTASAAQKTE